MRLKECGLTTLKTRRLRGDQIEVFKILNGYENIGRNNLSLTHTLRQIGWTLDKPMGFLVHLPSRVDSLSKSCRCYLLSAVFVVESHGILRQ